MEALFVSTGVVALAEIGDKTQLLAFILAARFNKPVPIIAGILIATLINHGMAGALGAWITSVVSSVPTFFRGERAGWARNTGLNPLRVV